MKTRQDFSEPDKRGIVRNSLGVTGIRSPLGYIFYFKNEAEERYARLLAQSPFSRRPHFMGPVVENDKLVIESSGRSVTVAPETWEGLRDALVKIHFEFVPRKVTNEF